MPSGKLVKKPVSTKKRPKKQVKKGESKITSPFMRKTNPSLIYLDNNGTTRMCDEAMAVYNSWAKCLNPSSKSRFAVEERRVIEKTKNKIRSLQNINEDSHKIIFTASGSESNNLIIRSVVDAFWRLKQEVGKDDDLKPHIISSAIEHTSIIKCLETLESDGRVEYTLINPTIYGLIEPHEVKDAVQPNTILISIMHANNETGAIMDIKTIGSIAHENNIAMHSDCVQIYGKWPIDMKKSNIDAMSVSFHKLFSKGLGMLIISTQFIDQYKLTGQINGSQQDGLRAGTVHVPAIAAAGAALTINFRNRTAKNKKQLLLRKRIILAISKVYPIVDYATYIDSDVKHKSVEIVIMGPVSRKGSGLIHLPNTLMLSIAKNTGSKFCNVKFRDALDKAGVVVGIASTCLASSPNASHVLTAMKAPPVIKRGVIRISMSDNTTDAEIKKFIKIFLTVLKRQLRN